jgi:hypothetical protein
MARHSTSLSIETADQRFHNHSPLDFQKLKGDPDHIEKHLVSYIKDFFSNLCTIFEFFEFENEIENDRLQRSKPEFGVVGHRHGDGAPL